MTNQIPDDPLSQQEASAPFRVGDWIQIKVIKRKCWPGPSPVQQLRPLRDRLGSIFHTIRSRYLWQAAHLAERGSPTAKRGWVLNLIQLNIGDEFRSSDRLGAVRSPDLTIWTMKILRLPMVALLLGGVVWQAESWSRRGRSSLNASPLALMAIRSSSLSPQLLRNKGLKVDVSTPELLNINCNFSYCCACCYMA